MTQTQWISLAKLDATKERQLPFTEIILSIGSELGPYTFEATRVDNNEKCVVKQILIGNKIDINPLLDELKQTSKLDSNYCVSYLEANYSSRSLVLILELCEEGNLVEFLNDKSVNNRTVTTIVKQCVQCLNYIHEYHSDQKPHGFVHRSVRPDRFLIKDGNVRVSGFGLPRLKRVSSAYHSKHITRLTKLDIRSKIFRVSYTAPEVMKNWLTRILVFLTLRSFSLSKS